MPDLKRVRKPAEPDNSLSLSFFWRTSEAEVATMRANALFIHSKLVAGGMDPQTSKEAIQRLWSDAFREGDTDGRWEQAYANDNQN